MNANTPPHLGDRDHAHGHSCENHAQEKITSGVNRRDFIVSLAGGLSIGFFLGGGERAEAQAPAILETQVNAYVKIGTDGTVTLLYGGSEMGQGTMSGLAQLLAEELMIEWDQVTVEQALAGKVSYLTGGSGAIKGRYLPLRTAGATARELLVAAAMITTGDNVRANYAANAGAVTYTRPADGAKLTWGYADLAATAAGAAAQALLLALYPPVAPATTANVPLTNPANFRIIGKPVERLDLPLKVNGSAIYGIDVWFPDMVFGVIKHCPTFGGVLTKMPAKPSGAIAVVPVKAYDNRGAVVKDSINAVAVVATNTWAAKKLASSLKVSWTLPASTTTIDSAGITALAQRLLATGTPLIAEPAAAPADIDAQVNAAIAGAAQKVSGVFTLPYVAHATMEVLNCTAKVTFSGSTPTACEVWAPNQAANSVVATATAITGLPATAIIVHTTFLGGGLGRKIEQDYVSQAIQVAMALPGKPVKLTWMREEDFGHDNYRPMALATVNAGLDAAGNIVGWNYKVATPSITAQRRPLAAGAVDSQAIEGAIKLPYNLGAKVTQWFPVPAGIPVGYWRSVGCSLNTFVSESMIDILAKAAGLDGFAYRYKIITDARALAVLQKADEVSQWRKSLPAGHAWGVAISQAFGTWVCEVAEVSETATSLRVHRVACVVDCGTVVNPDSVEAQMQGGIIHGLNAAMWSQTTFVKGVAQQTNFNKNRMMRIGESPAISVTIIPSTLPPTGTGEPGVPPIAPAVANAWAALPVGKRPYSLPFFPGAKMGGL